MSERNQNLVEVELWCDDRSAVDAVRATIRALPGDNDLTEDGGRFFVPDGFCAWACEQQGYVRRVIRDGRGKGGGT